MPASADKGKKGKPKGKKDEKSEEDEKLRLEREEAARQEALRKEKEEKLRKETEALINLFNEAKENMVLEAEDTLRFFKDLDAKYENIVKKESDELQWKAFTDCSTLPDLRSSKLVNNYISCWKDEEIVNEDHSFNRLLLQLQDIKRLSDGLLQEYSLAIGDRDEVKAAKFLEHLLEIRQAVYAKWNSFSLDVIQYLDYFPREATENLQLEYKENDAILGIWSNYSKNPRFKNVDFDGGRLSLTIPKPISLASVLIRILHDNSRSAINQFPTQHGLIDGDKRVIGGVLFLDLYEIPEPPKTGNGWSMRQIRELENFVSISYPFQRENDAADADGEGEEGSNSGQLESDQSSVYQLGVKIPIKLGTFIHGGSLCAFYWDSKNKKWASDGFSGISYENGFVSFKTVNFKPTIICHDTFCEFPFNSWNLKPDHASGEITFKINGKIHELSLVLKGEKCRLLSPIPDPEVFEGKWFYASELLQYLAYYGYNFTCPFAIELADPFVIKRKNPSVEVPCLENMSALSQYYEFQNSPYNGSASMSCIVYRARECRAGSSEDSPYKDFVFDFHHPVGDSLHQAAFELRDPGSNTDFKVKIKEGTMPHSTVFKHLYSLVDEGVQSQINQVDPILKKTVVQTLQSILPFSSA